MKEFIYLDEDAMNSVIAQLEGGVIQHFSNQTETGKTDSESSEKNKSYDMSASIIAASAKYIHEVKSIAGTDLTKSQTKSMDYALKDYAVDVLLEKIKDFSNFKTKASDVVEGDFVQLNESFFLYDFNLIKKITSKDNMSVIYQSQSEELRKVIDRNLKEVNDMKKIAQNKQDKQKLISTEKQLRDEKKNLENYTIDNFDKVGDASGFINEIIGGEVMVKTDNSISICRRENLRLSSGQSILLSDSKRKINVFGLASAIKDEVDPEGNNVDEFASHEMNKVPNLFFELFTSNFGMLKTGDILIHPIAIFYE